MPAFDGFIGAVVLAPEKWTVVNKVSPAVGNIFTTSINTNYNPGFSTRDLSQKLTVVYEEDDVGLHRMVDGPDDDTTVFIAVVPANIDLRDKAAIQPYLQTARYNLPAGAVRLMNGVIIPYGYSLIAYTSKPDLTVNVFGVEGRAGQYRASAA